MDSPSTQPAEAERHRSPWSTRQKVGRVLWAMVQATVFRASPSNFFAWRAMLLRLFGARLGEHVHVRPTVRIAIPWQLEIGDHTAIGDFAILYSLGRIKLGQFVTISQYAHLCAGTHDYTTVVMKLLKPAITIGDHVWIATDAFVGPGVTIGDRTILGARSSAFKDLPPDVIAVGNPAKPIKPRRISLEPSS